MARFRLSAPAQADLARILETSTRRWGEEGRRRYAHVLAAAMRMVANDPEGPLTRERDDLLRGVRSFHIRHARGQSQSRVKAPVHIIYYRAVEPGLIEIVRVLHDHIEPCRHIGQRGL